MWWWKARIKSTISIKSMEEWRRINYHQLAWFNFPCYNRSIYYLYLCYGADDSKQLPCLSPWNGKSHVLSFILLYSRHVFEPSHEHILPHIGLAADIFLLWLSDLRLWRLPGLLRSRGRGCHRWNLLWPSNWLIYHDWIRGNDMAHVIPNNLLFRSWNVNQCGIRFKLVWRFPAVDITTALPKRARNETHAGRPRWLTLKRNPHLLGIHVGRDLVLCRHRALHSGLFEYRSWPPKLLRQGYMSMATTPPFHGLK